MDDLQNTIVLIGQLCDRELQFSAGMQRYNQEISELALWKKKHQRWIYFFKNHQNQRSLSLNCITQTQISMLRRKVGIQSRPAELQTPPFLLFFPTHVNYICPCFTSTALLAQGKLIAVEEPAECPSFWWHPLFDVLDSYSPHLGRNTGLLYSAPRIYILSLLHKLPLI